MTLRSRDINERASATKLLLERRADPKTHRISVENLTEGIIREPPFLFVVARDDIGLTRFRIIVEKFGNGKPTVMYKADEDRDEAVKIAQEIKGEGNYWRMPRVEQIPKSRDTFVI